MLYQIQHNVPTERIFFTDKLSYEDYRKLLWRSDLHCYFSKPYIVSWSFFEAISCGINILSNTNKCTQGIAQDGTIFFTRLEKQSTLNQDIIGQLDESKTLNSQLRSQFTLDNCMRDWKDSLNLIIRSA